MKKCKFLSFALALSLLSAGFMACSDSDDDKTETGVDKNDPNVGDIIYEGLKTGAKTQFDGKSYYVISNHLETSFYRSVVPSFEKSATVVSTGDETADKLIKKYASDEYVEKLLGEVGIAKYIQLYNFDDRVTKITAANTAGNAYLSDPFVILNENGLQIAEFRERFDSNVFQKKFGEDGNNSVFNNLTPDELRANYEPTSFIVTTITDDLSKKYKIQNNYEYDKDGKVEISDSNLNYKSYNRHFIKINGKELSAYYFFDNSWIAYVLDDSTGNYFYKPNFITKDNGEVEVKIQAYGTSTADRNDENRNNTITARFNTTNKIIDITATLKGKKLAETGEEAKCVKLRLYKNTFAKTKNLPLSEQKVKVESGTDSKNVEEQKNNGKSYTFAEAVKAYFADYIRLSDKTVVVNGCTVPAKIYIRADFPKKTYPSAAGHDFLNVELVPVATEDSFKYVGLYKTNSDGTYADAFADCRASETAMKESDYVPSYAKLYGEAYEEIVKGSYTGKTDNPFSK